MRAPAHSRPASLRMRPPTRKRLRIIGLDPQRPVERGDRRVAPAEPRRTMPRLIIGRAHRQNLARQRHRSAVSASSSRPSASRAAPAWAAPANNSAADALPDRTRRARRLPFCAPSRTRPARSQRSGLATRSGISSRSARDGRLGIAVAQRIRRLIQHGIDGGVRDGRRRGGWRRGGRRRPSHANRSQERAQETYLCAQQTTLRPRAPRPLRASWARNACPGLTRRRRANNACEDWIL